MDLAAPASPVPDLRIGFLLRRAWRLFKTRPWFLAGATLVGNFLMPFIVAFVLELLRILVFAKSETLGNIFEIFNSLFSVCFISGLMIISIRMWRGEDVAFGLIFAGFRRFLHILGLFLLGMALFVAGGLALGFIAGMASGVAGSTTVGIVTILLALVGAYLTVAFGPSLLVILLTNLGLFAALRLSWNLTRGHRRTLFFVLVAASIFSVAGVLALGVGMFITVPVGQIMLMGAYDELARAYAARSEAAAPASGEALPAEA